MTKMRTVIPLLLAVSAFGSPTLGADLQERWSSEKDDMRRMRESMVKMIHSIDVAERRSADQSSVDGNAKVTRSADGTLQQAIEFLLTDVHARHKGHDGERRRDIDWDDEDVLGSDWENGGWGNGDSALGSLGRWGDSEDLDSNGFGYVHGNTEMSVPGNQEQGEDFDNTDWWGV